MYLEAGELLAAESSGVPVETGREVVGEELVRMLLAHAGGKLPCQSQSGSLRFHPYQVCIGRERAATTDTEVDTTTNTDTERNVL